MLASRVLIMRTLTLALTALLLATAPSLVRAEEAKLVILHTSDLHGSLYPYDDLAQRPVARGLVKVASLVDSVRATGLPVLLVDAGDTIEGPGMEAVHQLADSTSPDPMIAAMNQMGYDAMCVGNHEFDFGPRAWQRARHQAKFPWLAANVESEPPAPGSHSPSAFDTSLIKLVGGIRVGV